MPPPDALPEPAQVLDASGLLCPIPIVRTAAAVKGMADGEVLLVIATDAGIATDMPMWCKAMRHEHLATFRDGARWKSYLRKRPRPPRPAPGATTLEAAALDVAGQVSTRRVKA
jgi:tRNA 2-thiouridine synthesizing protein A